MTSLPFAATTPIHVARVGLRARDAEALSHFYGHVLGLEELRRTAEIIALGAAGRELIEIEHAPSLAPDDPSSAGLYHTAFLLPDRAALARWVRHAMESRIAITGASDHLVSEAIYLNDPEGNGIEIYADRAPEDWKREENGSIKMTTARLDLAGLAAALPEGDDGWDGAPDGTVVGHVHLRAGDTGEAEAWWNGEAGLDTMAHYGNQAVFLSSGGYHHHIGNNIWHSRGSGPRGRDRAGLSYVEMADENAADARVLFDPWGNEIRFVPKAV